MRRTPPMTHLVHDPHSPYGMTSQRVAQTSARDGIQRSNPQARQIQGLSNVVVETEFAAAHAHYEQNVAMDQYDRGSYELNLTRQRGEESARHDLDLLPPVMRIMAFTAFWKNLLGQLDQEIARITQVRDEQKRGLGRPVVEDPPYTSNETVNYNDPEQPYQWLTEMEEIELQVVAEAELYCTLLEAEENEKIPEWQQVWMRMQQQQEQQKEQQQELQQQQRQYSHTDYVRSSLPRNSASSASPQESQ